MNETVGHDAVFIGIKLVLWILPEKCGIGLPFFCQLRLDRLIQLSIRYQARGCTAQPDRIVL